VRSLGISEYLVLQVKLTTTATEILFEINVKETLITGIIGHKKQKTTTKTKNKQKNTKKTASHRRCLSFKPNADGIFHVVTKLSK
jgi:hypothetical protein